MQWVHAGDDPDGTWMQPLGLLGEHNRRNALIARAVCRPWASPRPRDEHAMARGRGVRRPGQPAAGCRHGRRRDFVDDSLSTNVLPTLAAVDSFPDRRVALLVGGQSRGIDYAPWPPGCGRGRPRPWC